MERSLEDKKEEILEHNIVLDGFYADSSQLPGFVTTF